MRARVALVGLRDAWPSAQCRSCPDLRRQSLSNQVARLSPVFLVVRLWPRRKFLGYPYSYTGASPATGFSCIGFVWVRVSSAWSRNGRRLGNGHVSNSR